MAEVVNSDWFIQQAEVSGEYLRTMVELYGRTAVRPGALALLEALDPRPLLSEPSNVAYVDFSSTRGEK